MALSRRSFVSAVAAGVAAPSLGVSSATNSKSLNLNRFDPWIEVSPAALRHNLHEVSRLAGATPILAVVKNNAYGLGVAETARLLADHSAVHGFAVVKTDVAIGLRESGVTKPILHMGMFASEDLDELHRKHIQLSVYTDDALMRLRPAFGTGRAVDVHVYVDTGMGRMGIPYHRAMPLLEDLARENGVAIQGTYMAFTEESDFDREQLQRFRDLAATARSRGMKLGRLHAASSNGVFHLPEARLDMVRPGIALYGAYPSRPDVERGMSRLECAFRLKARVVRVERLRVGDSVSYGRNYVAQQPTWTATLPVGHADGYPRRAVHGARVLIGDRTYPVIGAVSASHTIVELGESTNVAVGDVATLVGPDVPEIEPNRVAAVTGTSVYDILMHLNPTLPRHYTD